MKKIIDKKNIIFLVGYFSLIIGFIINEDISGGSRHDYLILQDNLIKTGFANGVFSYLFDFYVKGQLFHSPIFYILIYYLQNLFGNDLTRLFLLHVFLILPYLYYKNLNLKFKETNFLIYFILIFFLSTSYRSIAIWSGREILTIILLLVSIFNFLKFNNNFKLKYIYISFTFLAAASYISPEVGIISIIFFLDIYKTLGTKHVIRLLIFNLIIALPFLLYIYYYLQFERNLTSSFIMNLKNNSIFFFSSILIFTIPFVLTNLKNYFKFIKKKIFLFIAVTTFFMIINLNFESNIGGGALNFVLKKLELENIIFIFSSVGLINILYIFQINLKYNILVLSVFLIQTCLNFHFFHKYVDLFWVIYFVFLFKGSNIDYYLKNKKFITYLLSLYSSVFIGALIFK